MWKRAKIWVALSVLAIVTFGCEDVVEVDVPSEEPRLIVDALIRVDTTQQFTDFIIKVSETNSFFGIIPPAELQQITITNLDNGEGAILIEQEPGIYRNNDPFLTEDLLEGELLLQVDYKDEFYVARTRFRPSVPIDNLVQGEGGLFGDDETEVVITFTDIADEENYYLFDFDFANFLASEDTFYQDQQFEFSYFYDEAFDTGTELEISIMGVDKAFHDYMNLIIEQSNEDLGIFETPSITVRGNILNATDIDNIDNFDNVENSDNFALGYFAIVQEFKETLVVE